MKSFIIRIALLVAYAAVMYIAGIFIVIFFVHNPVWVYVFASIYTLLVIGSAILFVVTILNPPVKSN